MTLIVPRSRAIEYFKKTGRMPLDLGEVPRDPSQLEPIWKFRGTTYFRQFWRNPVFGVGVGLFFLQSVLSSELARYRTGKAPRSGIAEDFEDTWCLIKPRNLRDREGYEFLNANEEKLGGNATSNSNDRRKFQYYWGDPEPFSAFQWIPFRDWFK